jgi:hypothetical protein
MCVKSFFLQSKATMSFQDVEQIWQFYFAATAYVIAWIRFHRSLRLMEFF